MKNFFKNIMNTMTTEYDESDHELDDVMEEEQEIPVTGQQMATPASSFRPNRGSASYSAQPSAGVHMTLVEPKDFSQATRIVESLRQLRPVVINFEGTDSHETARIVDFISGAAFALDGKIEKVGTDIFICTPKNVVMEHLNHSTFTEFSEVPAPSWKEMK